MIFTDNMQIPVGAPHAFTAEKIMDFVYEPEVQAQITAYVQVRAAGQGRHGDPARSASRSSRESELIFPGPREGTQLQDVPPRTRKPRSTAAFQRAIGA